MKLSCFNSCSCTSAPSGVDDCIQGQSLPLSEVIKQYLITGIAPAPLPSQYEFNRDLTDDEFRHFDGHRLDHDLSELSYSNDSLDVIRRQLEANKKPSNKPESSDSPPIPTKTE